MDNPKLADINARFCLYIVMYIYSHLPTYAHLVCFRPHLTVALYTVLLTCCGVPFLSPRFSLCSFLVSSTSALRVTYLLDPVECR